MLKQLPIKKIIADWNLYEDPVREAFISSPGALAMGGDDYEKVSNALKLKLTNPFNNSMQLWISESEGKINYVVLTKFQICEFSGNKTLLLFSGTRISDVEELTMQEAYLEGYFELTQFAQEHECKAILAYSDLDYFVDKIQTTDIFSGVLKRNFFYLPLEN